MARPKGKNKIAARRLSPLARDIVDSLEEYASFKRGEKTGVVTHTLYAKAPDQVDVRAIRRKLGMTQEQFTMFGFSLSAIRHWEAERRTPEGPARTLLGVISKNPSIVLETLHG